jgi:hypothetical protein
MHRLAALAYGKVTGRASHGVALESKEKGATGRWPRFPQANYRSFVFLQVLVLSSLTFLRRFELVMPVILISRHGLLATPVPYPVIL